MEFLQYISGLRGRVFRTVPTTVVLGNMSADLDSVASSLTYAWLLQLERSGEQVLPLLDLHRKDVNLRPELLQIFELAGIEPQELLYRGDNILRQLQDEGMLRLILVDHNVLARRWRRLWPSVVAIVDHHLDEGSYPEGATTEFVEYGSISTAIAEKFLCRFKGNIDPAVATLLAGAIVRDTYGQSGFHDTATKLDIVALLSLHKFLKYSWVELSQRLSGARKEGIRYSNPEDYLQMDYKEWEIDDRCIGIPVIRTSFDRWCSKEPDLPEILDQFCRMGGLDLLMIIFLSTSSGSEGAGYRELLIYTPDSSHMKWIESAINRLLLRPSGDSASTTQELFGGSGRLFRLPLSLTRKKLHRLLNGG